MTRSRAELLETSDVWARTITIFPSRRVASVMGIIKAHSYKADLLHEGVQISSFVMVEILKPPLE